jgi:hypothetical protein
METKNEELFYGDINNKILEQAERLIDYISKEMKGRTVDIVLWDRRGGSTIRNFLASDSMMINIYYECSDDNENREDLEVTLFSSKNQYYEVVFRINGEDEMYWKLPMVLRDGLRRVAKLKKEMTVTL